MKDIENIYVDSKSNGDVNRQRDDVRRKHE